MSERITDFIGALQDEIDAVKKNRSASFPLVDGHLAGQLGHNWIYTFTSSAFINLEDDCPGQIEIAGQLCDCSIVNVSGLEVNVALALPCGTEIASARLITNRAQILMRLIDKFRTATPQLFKFAEEIFSGRAKPFGGVGNFAKFSFEATTPPDHSQKEAIANSFANSLAVIWGPPGTGKTRTIAQIAEAHVNAGRRVLVVSHANNAVDAVMKEIAKQMAKIYAQGKIVRVGLPKDQTLQKQFPLIILEQVVTATSAQLQQERASLEARCHPLTENLRRCRNLQAAGQSVRDLEREIQRPDKLIAQQTRFEQVLVNLADAQKQLAAAQQYVDPHLQETYTHDLTVRVSTLKTHAREIEDRLHQLVAAAANQHQELELANQELSQLMDETGLSPAEVAEHIEVAQTKVASLNAQIEQIENAVTSGRKKVLDEAQIVGTTLSKLFLSNLLSEQIFDILIVDEASMVPMPHLYWALTKATIGVTLVGDFKQLPPIASAESRLAKKWLSESIFDQLGINTVESARQNKIVSLLDTQYRMAPEIASLSSEMFYGGLIKSADNTYQIGITDSIFGNSRVVLIDTSAVDPWCSSPPAGSKINIYSAGLAVTLSQRLLSEHTDANINIGIATPYRAQAILTTKALSEVEHHERILASTVHGFQGGESSIIIFDCVDGKGSKKSVLDDYFGDSLKKSDVEFLLNVAVSRAKAIFVIIVNKQYFLDSQQGSTFTKFLEKVASSALYVDARQIDNCFIARADDGDQNGRVKTQIRAGSTLAGGALTRIFNEKDFWSAFRQDLDKAQSMVLIVSPFLTLKRSQNFTEQFKILVERGIKLSVITRPVSEHNQDHMADEARAVIELLESNGVNVIERSKIHQKVIIIDERICWEGSLNVLSQRNSLEQMRRLEGRALVAEVRRNLSL